LQPSEVSAQARLEAERDEADEIKLPSELPQVQYNYDLAAVIAGERKLFELRRTARLDWKAQLEERILQLQE
jgi:HlyD family secretion protein